MELRLLGAVELIAGDRPVNLGPPQQRLVAAALAADTGQPVTVDTLIDRIWDEVPPGGRRSLHMLVSRLRRVLRQAGAPVGVARRSGGYVLELDPDQVDAHRFEQLVRQGLDTDGDPGGRIGPLREALALWRGEPLTGLAGRWAEQMRTHWRQWYLDATLGWARAELAAGNPELVLGPLDALVHEYPLLEAPVEVLMQALYAAGRPAAALERYTELRGRLADELGTDPGPLVQQTYRAILRNDLAVSRPGPSPRRPVAPAQLPPDLPRFTGRAEHLARLDGLPGRSSGPVICGIGGTAGVGKTTLAVHWAHRVAHLFPGGQLYLNLRGFDPMGIPVRRAEAVRRFLDALAVPADRIPADPAAQVDLYRSLLADQRMLILLDNARDAEQVRPLLPGAPGCVVLVTSRIRLTSLVAVEGADWLTLDRPDEAESAQLLTARIGAARIEAEPEAARDIVARCARLPLALAIAAAQAATAPELTLTALAAQLHDATVLDTLDGGDPVTDLRAVFSSSYRALSGPAAELFRLLGLHVGPDISVPAAASLAGVPPDRIQPPLRELVRTNLLIEVAAGRYGSHDLLREYAAQLARDSDPTASRQAATQRLLDHYLHNGHAADRLLYPLRDQIELPAPVPGVYREPIQDQEQAIAWFAAEHAVLLAATDRAAALGFPAHTRYLAWVLTTFLYRRGHWHDWQATQQAAFAAARASGDLSAQARALRSLGAVATELGRPDEAETSLRQALRCYQELADPTGQAYTRLALGWVLHLQERHRPALEQAQEALQLYESTGYTPGRAHALNAIGWYHAQLGRYQEAVEYGERALQLLADLDDRPGTAATWDSLGYAYRHLGQYGRAATCYGRAVDLYGDLDDRYDQAQSWIGLGDTHRAAGASDAAGRAWQRALALLSELRHPDAEAVRARLAALATPARPSSVTASVPDQPDPIADGSLRLR